MDRTKLYYFQFFIGFISVMVGLFLYITHYDKPTGSFFIKTGLIFEIVTIIRFYIFSKKRYKQVS